MGDLFREVDEIKDVLNDLAGGELPSISEEPPAPIATSTPLATFFRGTFGSPDKMVKRVAVLYALTAMSAATSMTVENRAFLFLTLSRSKPFTLAVAKGVDLAFGLGAKTGAPAINTGYTPEQQFQAKNLWAAP